MDIELDLESRARKAMGSSFNTDKFGDKPLKMIDEKEEALAISEDEEEKNKKIPHPGIRLPEGNFSIKRKK